MFCVPADESETSLHKFKVAFSVGPISEDEYVKTCIKCCEELSTRLARLVRGDDSTRLIVHSF